MKSAPKVKWTKARSKHSDNQKAAIHVKNK